MSLVYVKISAHNILVSKLNREQIFIFSIGIFYFVIGGVYIASQLSRLIDECHINPVECLLSQYPDHTFSIFGDLNTPEVS